MILSYAPGRTLLHRLNPLSKLAAVLAACTTLFLFGGVAYNLVCLAAVLAFAFFAGLGEVTRILRGRFASILGLWLIVGNAIFTSQGKVLLSIPLYFFRIAITDVGLTAGIIQTARFMAVFLVSALFVVSTEPAALVYSLMRRGLPYRYGFLLVLMLRFAPLFESERRMVSDAQKMRGLEIDKRGIRKLYRALRYTLVPLIVSALGKVDSLVMSMEGRAFGYRSVRTFTIEDRYAVRDKVLIAASLAVLVLVFAFRIVAMAWLRGQPLSPMP